MDLYHLYNKLSALGFTLILIVANGEKMNSNNLFHLKWEKYLTILFLLFGTSFFSSGLVTWIAANWDYFSKFQKLYGTQFGLIVSLLLALVFYLRENKRLNQERIKWGSSIFFFISAVFIGTLFALIGQIYQTGANTWELFALWSVLQIPLLLILPNIGSALLFMVTLNITLGLYGNTFHLIELTTYLFVGLNLCFVILAEIFYKKLQDESWRIVPKIANIALALSLFFVVAVDFRDSWKWLSFIISIGCIVFYRKRFELFPLSVHFTALIINFDIFLLSKSFDVSTTFFAILFSLGAFVLGVFQLKKLFFIRYPNLEISSIIQVIFTILAIFMTGLVLSLIYLVNKEAKEVILITAVALFVLALIFHYKKIQDYIADLLMAVSVVLAFFYFLLNMDGYYGSYAENSDFSNAVWVMALYLILIYYFKSTLWLRTLAVSLFIISLLVYFKKYSWDYLLLAGEQYNEKVEISLLQQFFSFAVEHWLMCGAVILFYCKGMISINNDTNTLSKSIAAITPIAWAFTLLAFGIYFTSTAFRMSSFLEGAELPSVTSFSDLFNILTNNIFSGLKAEWWLYHLFYFSVCLLPLLVFLLINRNFALKSVNKWLIAVMLALFSLSFVAMNVILFCLALLLLAYITSSRILFAVATLFLMITLAFYYYWLAVPLLYKSLLLLLFGSLFCMASVFLYQSFRTVNKSSNIESDIPKKSFILQAKPIFSLMALAIILGIANYSVIKYEDVLNNGKPIILKLAPIDPRSLMQGDYMRLNYEIMTQFRQQFYGEDSNRMRIKELEGRQNISKVYVLLKSGEKGAMDLCRVELSPPTDFTGCQAEVYLPINTTDSWNSTLPSHSYFFAEGKGAYYAKAAYGEYRFKDGKALLAQLLDENLKPL